MHVKQISVFIENTPGKLAAFTKLLGENGIDLVSLSVADTTNFGILRGIVADYERAVQLIADNGYTVKLTDVLAVKVPDTPGGLAQVLDVLAENNIVLNTGVHGVRFYSGATDSTARNNIIVNARIGLYYKATAGKRLAQGNVVINCPNTNYSDLSGGRPIRDISNTSATPVTFTTPIPPI